jgi:hypothetical protein
MRPVLVRVNIPSRAAVRVRSGEKSLERKTGALSCQVIAKVVSSPRAAISM